MNKIIFLFGKFSEECSIDILRPCVKTLVEFNIFFFCGGGGGGGGGGLNVALLG